MSEYIPDGYGLSRNRMKELRAFCFQYDEWRQKRNDCYFVGSPIVSDMPRGGATTSATERKAIEAQKYSDKIDKIERSALKASDGSEVLYHCLIRCVTRGIMYERLGTVPCGRRQFYNMRRLFFWLLDKEV